MLLAVLSLAATGCKTDEAVKKDTKDAAGEVKKAADDAGEAGKKAANDVEKKIPGDGDDDGK